MAKRLNMRTLQMQDTINRLVRQREGFLAALRAIDRIAGNLSDERIEAVGGVNDGKQRALWVIEARRIAHDVIALSELERAEVQS